MMSKQELLYWERLSEEKMTAIPVLLRLYAARAR